MSVARVYRTPSYFKVKSPCVVCCVGKIFSSAESRIVAALFAIFSLIRAHATLLPMCAMAWWLLVLCMGPQRVRQLLFAGCSDAGA